MRAAVTRVRLQDLGGDEVTLALLGEAFEEAVEAVVLFFKGNHLGADVVGRAVKVLPWVDACVEKPSEAEDVDVEIAAGHCKQVYEMASRSNYETAAKFGQHSICTCFLIKRVFGSAFWSFAGVLMTWKCMETLFQT